MRTALLGIVFVLASAGSYAAIDVVASAQQCDSGKAVACSQLAAAYKNGAGVRKDVVQSALFYIKGCALGDEDTHDCYDAGFMLARSEKTKGDAEKIDAAFAQWVKSCGEGNVADCNYVGLINQMGLRRAKNPEKAGAAYEKACDGGIVSACAAAASIYHDLEPRDAPKIARLLQKACEGNVGWQCTLLGHAYEEGEGVTKDLARAARYYQQACDLQSGLGCAALGEMDGNGNGVQKNLLSAVIHYKKACDFREVRGCQGLAQIYMSDPVTAKKLFEDACRQIGRCEDFRGLMSGIEAATQLKKSH